MSYQTFLNEVQNKGSHEYRIAHCYGVRDAWKWVRKNKWALLRGTPCSSSTYSTIIKEVHKELIDQLLEGHAVELPHQMGNLQVVGFKQGAFIKKGKMKVAYPVDWKKTMLYWFTDSAAKASKQVVKRVIPYRYYLLYSKSSACYRNQRYYRFHACRSFVRTLMNKTENEKINALIY